MSIPELTKRTFAVALTDSVHGVRSSKMDRKFTNWMTKVCFICHLSFLLCLRINLIINRFQVIYVPVRNGDKMHN